MRKRVSFITSLFIHLFFVILFLLSDFNEYTPDEEETLEIKLIKKKVHNTVSDSFGDIKEIDILSGARENQITDLDYTSTSDSLAEISMSPNIPVLTQSLTGNRYSSSNEDFESSLNALAPEVFDEIKEETDSISITWEGESERYPVSGTDIDFSQFPSASFTGVGVKASFSVNRKGEVYDVYIMPPGSGSVEFDILVKSYISKFFFTEGESVSKGEVYIVYKK